MRQLVVATQPRGADRESVQARVASANTDLERNDTDTGECDVANFRFSIVGATDSSRNDPTRADAYKSEVGIDETRAIARAIGAELAKRGHGLTVYDAMFIEADAVTGYVSARPAPGRGQPLIVICQPQDSKFVPFLEEATHSALFERRADKSGLWEVSFYRSLIDSGGVILQGGADSTSIAGQVAIAARIPVLALERTGGAATTIWRTIAPGIDLPTINEHARGPRPCARGRHRMGRRAGGAAGAALRGRERADPLACGVYIGAVRACAGGSAREQPDLGHAGRGRQDAPAPGHFAIRSLRRGHPHGLRAALRKRVAAALDRHHLHPRDDGRRAYLVAQPTLLDLKSDRGFRLMAIVIAISTIGGLTAESIFHKLLGIDVLQTRGLSTQGNATAKGGSKP